MAMRPVLKKLYSIIEAAYPAGWRLNHKRYFVNADGSEFDEQKQKWLKGFWRRNCVKLEPFTLPAGTRWVSKSSSGNYGGTIVEDCKAIGLVHNVGYALLLDKPVSLSNYCKDHQIPLKWDDDEVELSALPTELLEKILANVKQS